MNLKVMLKALLDLKMSEVITDKATLIYDADILEEGVEVFIQDPENADKVIPAEDGEYVAEDGRIIVYPSLFGLVFRYTSLQPLLVHKDYLFRFSVAVLCLS